MVKNVSSFQKVRATLRSSLDENQFGAEAEPPRLSRFIHFWALVGRSFFRNRCPLRASALSYTTLLALIPMLAVALSVTSGLLKKQGEEKIYQFIDRFVSDIMPPPATVNTNAPAGATAAAPNSPAASASTQTLAGTNGPAGPNGAARAGKGGQVIAAQKEAAVHIHEFIQHTQSGAIGGVGMLSLLYMAIRMLSQVEDTFNAIWGVTRGRNWLMRVMIYWAAITLGPLLLAAAMGLASGPFLHATHTVLARMHVIGDIVFGFSTMAVLWLTFALLYKAVPNTKVHFSAALVGGVVGGSLWYLNNVFGFLYVSRVVTYSKIYGGLGLVPVFMAGIYLSWFILLFGAQVAYAFQNRRLYLQEKLAENVNQRGREFVALRLLTCVGQRFQRGLPAPSVQQMSNELAIPSRLVQEVLRTLVAAHLVSEIAAADPAYLPARPLDSINAHHVLMAMRATQGQELVTRDEPVRQEVYGEFARIQEAEKEVASSVSLLALVHRAEARAELTSVASAAGDLKMTPALVPPLESVLRPATESTANPETAAGAAPQSESEARRRDEAPPGRAVSEPVPEAERDFPL